MFWRTTTKLSCSIKYQEVKIHKRSRLMRRIQIIVEWGNNMLRAVQALWDNRITFRINKAFEVDACQTLQKLREYLLPMARDLPWHKLDTTASKCQCRYAWTISAIGHGTPIKKLDSAISAITTEPSTRSPTNHWCTRADPLRLPI